jgi:acylphosphatase
MSSTSIVHLVIRGRVQGVGFRAWTQHQGELRGLTGWVRNRRDGSVEAVVSGRAAEVAQMVCREGPRGSSSTTWKKHQPIARSWRRRRRAPSASCRRPERLGQPLGFGWKASTGPPTSFHLPKPPSMWATGFKPMSLAVAAASAERMPPAQKKTKRLS